MPKLLVWPMFGIISLAILCPFSFAQVRSELIQSVLRNQALHLNEEVTHALQNCVQSQNSRPSNPDAPIAIHVISPDLEGVREVVMHNAERTDRVANSGIIAYMRDSVLADDNFFDSAVRFYTALRTADVARHATFDLSPMQNEATFDVWEMAMNATQRDPYMALRVLALYGHDNQNQMLGTLGLSGQDCRVALLDAIMPLYNSNLYLRGAMAGQGYSANTISEGLAVGAACRALQNRALRMLCNDNRADYQGDYYHVIAGAFLGCRGRIRSAQYQGASPLIHYGAGNLNGQYLNRVAQYKIARFNEELDELAQTHHEYRDMIRIMRHRLNEADFRNPESPLLPPLATLRSGFWGSLLNSNINEADYAQMVTILRRYRFEINFRVRQHALGMSFGQAHCEGRAQLSPVCGVN